MNSTELKKFKVERDENGRIPLRTKDGKIVTFIHAVDAREALDSRDPVTGEQVYFTVAFKRKISEPVIEKKDVEVVTEEGVIVANNVIEPALETPPVLNTFRKITPGRRGRPKATESGVPKEE